jgi:hypothetical protein
MMVHKLRIRLSVVRMILDRVGVDNFSRLKSPMLYSRVVDPDPDSVTLWIRIRIVNPDPDPGARK